MSEKQPSSSHVKQKRLLMIQLKLEYYWEGRDPFRASQMSKTLPMWT